MLNYSLLRYAAAVKIEEISIFSNGCNFDWRAVLSNTIVKGDHPWAFPTKFGLIRFKGEDLNVKDYDV